MRLFNILIAPMVVLAILCLAPSIGMATVVAPPHYFIDKGSENYGNLDQNDITNFVGNVSCGPVAAVNSFVYLQNKYPDTYDESLVGDPSVYQNLVDAAETLCGPNYMNTQPPGGTYADMFIYGKQKYLEEELPGKTSYAAQMNFTWGIAGNPPRPANQIPPIPKPAWVQDNTYPTWQFIYGELKACEDVEVLINWTNGGHFLTLTGFDWTDTNSDNKIQQSEDATIYYIDPATGAPGHSAIWNNGNNQLQTDYQAGAIFTTAVSESPIPEPATMVLIAMSMVGMAGTIRRRMR